MRVFQGTKEIYLLIVSRLNLRLFKVNKHLVQQRKKRRSKNLAKILNFRRTLPQQFRIPKRSLRQFLPNSEEIRQNRRNRIRIRNLTQFMTTRNSQKNQSIAHLQTKKSQTNCQFLKKTRLLFSSQNTSHLERSKKQRILFLKSCNKRLCAIKKTFRLFSRKMCKKGF